MYCRVQSIDLTYEQFDDLMFELFRLERAELLIFEREQQVDVARDVNSERWKQFYWPRRAKGLLRFAWRDSVCLCFVGGQRERNWPGLAQDVGRLPDEEDCGPQERWWEAAAARRAARYNFKQVPQGCAALGAAPTAGVCVGQERARLGSQMAAELAAVALVGRFRCNVGGTHTRGAAAAAAAMKKRRRCGAAAAAAGAGLC